MQAFTETLHRDRLNFRQKVSSLLNTMHIFHRSVQRLLVFFSKETKEPVFGQCSKYYLERSQDLELRVLDKWLLLSVFCKAALHKEVLSWHCLFLVVWRSMVQIPDSGHGCICPPDLLTLSWLKLGMKIRTKCRCLDSMKCVHFLLKLQHLP